MLIVKPKENNCLKMLMVVLLVNLIVHGEAQAQDVGGTAEASTKPAIVNFPDSSLFEKKSYGPPDWAYNDDFDVGEDDFSSAGGERMGPSLDAEYYYLDKTIQPPRVISRGQIITSSRMNRDGSKKGRSAEDDLYSWFLLGLHGNITLVHLRYQDFLRYLRLNIASLTDCQYEYVHINSISYTPSLIVNISLLVNVRNTSDNGLKSVPVTTVKYGVSTGKKIEQESDDREMLKPANTAVLHQLAEVNDTLMELSGTPFTVLSFVSANEILQPRSSVLSSAAAASAAHQDYDEEALIYLGAGVAIAFVLSACLLVCVLVSVRKNDFASSSKSAGGGRSNSISGSGGPGSALERGVSRMGSFDSHHPMLANSSINSTCSTICRFTTGDQQQPMGDGGSLSIIDHEHGSVTNTEQSFAMCSNSISDHGANNIDSVDICFNEDQIMDEESFLMRRSIMTPAMVEVVDNLAALRASCHSLNLLGLSRLGNPVEVVARGAEPGLEPAHYVVDNNFQSVDNNTVDCLPISQDHWDRLELDGNNYQGQVFSPLDPCETIYPMMLPPHHDGEDEDTEYHTYQPFMDTNGQTTVVRPQFHAANVSMVAYNLSPEVYDMTAAGPNNSSMTGLSSNITPPPAFMADDEDGHLANDQTTIAVSGVASSAAGITAPTTQQLCRHQVALGVQHYDDSDSDDASASSSSSGSGGSSSPDDDADDKSDISDSAVVISIIENKNQRCTGHRPPEINALHGLSSQEGTPTQAAIQHDVAAVHQHGANATPHLHQVGDCPPGGGEEQRPEAKTLCRHAARLSHHPPPPTPLRIDSLSPKSRPIQLVTIVSNESGSSHGVDRQKAESSEEDPPTEDAMSAPAETSQDDCPLGATAIIQDNNGQNELPVNDPNPDSNTESSSET